MYIFGGARAGAAFRTQAELDALIGKLSTSGYQPVLRSASRELLNLAGIGSKATLAQESNLIVGLLTDARYSRQRADGYMLGDIFFKDGSTLMVQPLGAQLVIGELRGHENTEQLTDFGEAVAKAAQSALDGRRLRGMSFEWAALTEEWLRNTGPYGARSHLTNKRALRSKNELRTKPASITPDDVEDANLLVSAEQRLFLQRLVQLGKVRSVDARQDASPEIVDPLLGRGLVRKEFLVVCKKDSSTLCTAESKEEISGVKFSCSNCGRPFSDEQVQEIYAPTARSREKTSSSHWMTVWITELLTKAGVGIEQISWGATAGEDELDIIAVINGVSVFFELKDREFGLGDAYPFSSRVQRYGGDFGVIVSMDKVAEEVVNYLKEQRGSRIYALAGEEEIRTDLPRVLEAVAANAALETVSVLLSRTGVDIRPLLQEWMQYGQRMALPFGPSYDWLTLTSG